MKKAASRYRFSVRSAALLFSLMCCLGSSASADPTFADGVNQGVVMAPGGEISGITASRDNDGVLWVHNDSGDLARIYAVSSTGALLGTYNIMLPGTTTFATADDFEDITIGPGPEPGVSYVYVGDIGGARSVVTIYRIAEPAVYLRQAAAPITVDLNQGEWEEITLLYPGLWPFNRRDSESLMMDPWTGDLYIGTKKADPVIEIYQALAADLATGGPAIMAHVIDVDLGDDASAGCISPRGNEIILRHETFAKLWVRALGQTVGDALATTPVSVPIRPEPNGEAVTFDAIGDGYYTTSEVGNQPLYYYARTSDDGPTPPLALVAPEAVWRYLDDGSNQGTAWRQPAFDDSAWSSGDAQLGYGDGDEQTVVSYGGNPSDKHITTYFRKTFELDDPTIFDSLLVKLVYDDGIGIYLNGIETARRNLAGGAGYDDPADSERQALENTWISVSVDPNLLVDGTNTLAVEVHLADAASPDLSFDLQLVGTPRPVRLELTETNDPWGDVEVAPAPEDPNDMQFAWGTSVTLTAQPIEGKAFGQWTIFDPNFPNDANYATIDANLSTVIVMDTDMHVNVVFKCGSGAGPLLPMILLVLGTVCLGRRNVD